MRVYVLMSGAYDAYGLESVHASMASAKAVYPGAKWVTDGKSPRVCWAQEGTDDEYVEIWEHTVLGAQNTESNP